MALTSRLGFCLGLLSLGLAACSRSSGDARHAEAFFQDPVRRPDHDAVLVLMPDTEHTRAVLLGIRDEVGDELDVLVRPVDRDLSAEEIEAMLAELQPRCVVLMDNPTVKAYRELQLARPSVTFPPAVVVMASFLEEHYRLVKNATGIAYEVPALTLFTHLRTILVSPVEKVGVVYRPAFRGYIDRQREPRSGKRSSSSAWPCPSTRACATCGAPSRPYGPSAAPTPSGSSTTTACSLRS